MSETPAGEVTQILSSLGSGDRSAANRLMTLVYDDLRAAAHKCMQGESPNITLDATGLVNEAYLKLVDHNRVDWRGRTHFFAVGANVMRRILVDHARGRNRLKRGGGCHRLELRDDMKLSVDRDEDLLAVDEAIEKLGREDPRQAKIVELRFFGGLTVEEVAEVLGVSKRTVESEWTMIRAWLRRELSPEDEA